MNAHNRDELRKREAHYIRTLRCVNKFIPDRTKREWSVEYLEINRDRLKEYRTQYAIDNKGKEINRHKLYYSKHKDIVDCACGSSFQHYNISRHIKTNIHKTYLQNNINTTINETD